MLQSVPDHNKFPGIVKKAVDACRIFRYIAMFEIHIWNRKIIVSHKQASCNYILMVHFCISLIHNY